VQVNHRFAPSRSPEEAVRHIEEVFAGFEVRIVDIAAGARPGLEVPIARAFVEAVGAEPRPKYGWTDVARFAGLGVPAVNYGPGDPLKAHADDEYVPVDQIRAVEAGLRAWLTGA
jgi:succinyl-diaminopimelate desuccinylase